jgi:hypothetical protein
VIKHLLQPRTNRFALRCRIDDRLAKCELEELRPFGQPFRAGVGYPLGPNERFQVIPFSSPRLRLAHCKFERFCLAPLSGPHVR